MWRVELRDAKREGLKAEWILKALSIPILAMGIFLTYSQLRFLLSFQGEERLSFFLTNGIFLFLFGRLLWVGGSCFRDQTYNNALRVCRFYGVVFFLVLYLPALLLFSYFTRGTFFHGDLTVSFLLGVLVLFPSIFLYRRLKKALGLSLHAAEGRGGQGVKKESYRGA